MRKVLAIIGMLAIMLASCKTKYIETVHYEPVEVHDTTYQYVHDYDSIYLHDSIFIHAINDTVYRDRWRVEYKVKMKYDTMFRFKEVPKIVTDTIYQVREVPVENIVYKQRWWQKALSAIGGLFGIGLLISIYLNLRK